jgi:hypothetical protein
MCMFPNRVRLLETRRAGTTLTGRKSAAALYEVRASMTQGFLQYSTDGFRFAVLHWSWSNPLQEIMTTLLWFFTVSFSERFVWGGRRPAGHDQKHIEDEERNGNVVEESRLA